MNKINDEIGKGTTDLGLFSPQELKALVQARNNAYTVRIEYDSKNETFRFIGPFSADFISDCSAHDICKRIHPDWQTDWNHQIERLHHDVGFCCKFQTVMTSLELGGYRTFCFTLFAETDAQGKVDHYSGMVEDITDSVVQHLQRVQDKKRTDKLVHQLIEECRINLFRYQPGSRRVQMVDPCSAGKNKELAVERVIASFPEKYKQRLTDFFDQCDRREMDRNEIDGSWMTSLSAEPKMYRLLITPIYDEDGKVLEYGLMQIDESERMRLLEEKKEASELLSVVMNNIPVLVFVKDLDHDSRIVTANERYAHYFGKTAKELIGKTALDYSSKLVGSALIEKDKESEKYDISHPFFEISRFMDDEGQCHYFQNTKFVHTLNGRKLLFGFCSDVTDLQLAKEKAETNDRLKSAFLANISHEIRTPLNAIVGYSDLIVNNLSPEDNQQFNNIIRSNSQHLLRLIGDILDMSKLEAHAMQFFFSDFNVHEMMGESYLTMLEKFSDKPEVKLLYTPIDVPLMVHQDRVRVAEVLTNFLTNAYKYTDQGSVSMWLEPKGDRFRICVKDTGSGIPKEHLNEVFDRFAMVEGCKHEGNGLGLAISKGICDYLDGTIGVESEQGKGSLFWAELPINCRKG